MKTPRDRHVHAALASLLLAAAAIHFAMAPSHLAEWPKGGWGFLVAGWLQAGTALLAVLRPARRLWIATIAVNAAIVFAWAVSRTTGLPVGPDRGEAEPAGIVDLTAVALELGAIAAATTLLLSPRRLDALAGRAAAVVALFAIGLTTAALASPSARDHAQHGDDPSHATADDTGLSRIRHSHGAPANHKLDPATRRKLDGQLARARAALMRWPTLADAQRDGYRRAGPYTPGQGLHLMRRDVEELNRDGVMDPRDLLQPGALMFMGPDPRARPVGMLYSASSVTEPEGFAGRNDGWHLHEGICAVERPDGSLDTPFGSQRRDAECRALGGRIVERSMWMVHVWVADGFDDVEDGPFAGINPQLGCSDGTYNSLPQKEWRSHPLNVCRSGKSKVLR